MSILSDRELQCIRFLALGLRPAAISVDLGISTKTVEKHIFTAKKKLNARTREHAVAIAILDKHIEIE